MSLINKVTQDEQVLVISPPAWETILYDEKVLTPLLSPFVGNEPVVEIVINHEGLREHRFSEDLST